VAVGDVQLIGISTARGDFQKEGGGAPGKTLKEEGLQGGVVAYRRKEFYTTPTLKNP